MMHLSRGQYCEGSANWSALSGGRFVYFNEAGPAPDVAEVEAKALKAQPEGPKEPVQVLGQESFDDMVKPFNAKFDEFKKAAEESAGGRMALGVRMTSMSAIGDRIRVLSRFTQISNDYHEGTKGLQVDSPVYQEAVQTAKADLNQLIDKMDARIQELKGGEDKVEADEGLDAPIPPFSLKLNDPLTTSPEIYNQVMRDNVETAQNELVNYLNTSRQLVLSKAVKGWKEPAKTERLQYLNKRIDEFIKSITQATNAMLQALRNSLGESIKDQQVALNGPAKQLSTLLLSHRGVMQSYIPYELNDGFSEISNRILLGTDGGYLSKKVEASSDVKEEESEEQDDVDKYIPEFHLDLKKVPTEPSLKFNEVLIENVKEADSKLIRYLKSNRDSVAKQGARKINKDPTEYQSNLDRFNSRIEAFIRNLRRAFGDVVRKLETVKEKPVQEQKNALKLPILALQKVMAQDFGFMQSYVPFKLTRGMGEIDKGIMKPLRIPRAFF